MTHMTLQAVRQLIANDSYAITFQSFGQYRTALLRHFDSLVDQPQGAQAAGEIIDQCMVAMNRHYPLPVTAHTSVAMRAMEDRDAFRKGWVERGLAAIAEKAEAPATEELVHALRQAERLLRAAGFAMNGTASSQIVAAIAAHSAAAQQAAAPGALAGFAWLPLEPTEEMIDAGADDHGHDEWRHDPDATAPSRTTVMTDIYKAMAAAAPSAPGTPEAPQTAAERDVLAERKRQVEVEGWAPARDDCYVKEELRAAALCYMRWKDITKPGIPPGAWPWNPRWWKPADDRRNLVKATALMLAEIERLDRAEAKGGA